MSPLDGPEIFVAYIIGAVLLFYTVVAFARKHRFRTLSSRLHATYTATGWFDAGKVLGPNFEIHARPAEGGRNRSYRTHVQVMSPRLPGTYLLRTEFFKDFPDWRFAMTPGERKERVFYHYNFAGLLRRNLAGSASHTFGVVPGL